MKNKSKKNNHINLLIVIFINLLIFGATNIMFDVKYEQVDDFIIYNLYSGLDGTYNLHGIYIHPLICLIISVLYRIIPIINWHSIFLLSIQFICFTLIGYTIVKKHNNELAIILYIVFASVFYSTLLMLIQYTSVAALLIITSFILFIDRVEKEEKVKIKKSILIFILYMIGIMTRMQSLLIVIPFMGLYFFINIIKYKYKTIQKDKIVTIIKYYTVYLLITLVVLISTNIIYNSNQVYKNYMEYNDIRSTLHDIIYVDYNENKEIFDEIGWSKNDHYMFYTFNFGDENIYSKDNLQKILEYKIQKDGMYKISTNLYEIIKRLFEEMRYSIPYMSILFIIIFIISLFNKNRKKENILIFITTILIHLLFIIINRSMLRVVIPEYILGAALIMYNLKFKYKDKINDDMKNCLIVICIIVSICMLCGNKYNYQYKLDDYKNYQELINYTSNNKQNVYLYTTPALQYRYLVYPVYKMPTKSSFSNLRVIGGWDI
ncbi:MAG: hypothetical protein HFJ40_06190 [Clostridia bacterium]|nr:hypothetical protein [Clostridia bacterium]